MAIRTRQSLSGTPGRPYGAWAAKTAAPIDGTIWTITISVADVRPSARAAHVYPTAPAADLRPSARVHVKEP